MNRRGWRLGWWPISFSSGASISLTGTETALKLSYPLAGIPVSYEIPVVTTPMHFGGHREWLLCPACWKRFAILNIASDRFRCRRCNSNGLFYQTCASEAFGTLIAAWQARHARDPVVRGAMLGIAREELGHAQHAFEIADWITPHLPRPQRAVVLDAQEATLDGLRANAEADLPPDLVALAGMPSRAVADELLFGLRSVLRA